MNSPIIRSSRTELENIRTGQRQLGKRSHSPLFFFAASARHPRSNPSRVYDDQGCPMLLICLTVHLPQLRGSLVSACSAACWAYRAASTELSFCRSSTRPIYTASAEDCSIGRAHLRMSRTELRSPHAADQMCVKGGD